MRSKDSSMGPTISDQLLPSHKIPQLPGQLQIASEDSRDGSPSIRESATGISELREAFIRAGQSAISSATESFISTELIPYLLKLSPGDLNLLSQRYVLEAVSSSERLGGSSFSFKFTIRLSSKYPGTDGSKLLASRQLNDILKYLSRIPTRY